ncbi:MBL fold metallo-hydrolase [Candidatus Parcubacteria bacterium]|nr:MBL fold metallo-hydrolase [Candidatus Parcubacteria bacterium]
MIKLTIVYDNESGPGLKSDWGFSCLIENAKKILFDTGADSEILLYNMKQLEINPKDIDIVVLSHNHWDHTGGLKGFLEVNENRAKIYQSGDFSKPTKIFQEVYSTGALGAFIKEQSLVVNTKKGNIIITGCAHPGLENIIDKAKELGEIYGIVGGFHGFSRLEKLKGIELIAPCHCTRRKQEIKERYPANYKEIKAGSVIEI